MKQVQLFSYVKEPNDSLPVPVDNQEINLNLFFENPNEEIIIRRLAEKRNLPVQTCKIIYNLYFNSVFKKVTTSDKKTIVLSPYYKFYKTK